MSFLLNGVSQDCAHGCTSLAEHLQRMDAESHVERFENEFLEYVGGIASVIVLSDTAATAKPSIQALVNSYHDLGREISPLYMTASHYNTLRMFVALTGAQLEHSGENESLKILEQANAARLGSGA
ncbi:hypothetical protein LPN04_29805 [Rugamonas sp. A1-17]|nr:hypothetical protein [Rugamonas sp. A1-17]